MPRVAGQPVAKLTDCTGARLLSEPIADCARSHRRSVSRTLIGAPSERQASSWEQRSGSPRSAGGCYLYQPGSHGTTERSRASVRQRKTWLFQGTSGRSLHREIASPAQGGIYSEHDVHDAKDHPAQKDASAWFAIIHPLCRNMSKFTASVDRFLGGPSLRKSPSKSWPAGSRSLRHRSGFRWCRTERCF